jgi:putative colanic acid biosynthesis glycosyltransferase
LLTDIGARSPASLSVITVVRNDREGLGRTYGSLQRQHDQAFEWVIVDGASTDGTRSLIADLSDERTRWISEPDDGIYDAMNRGIRLATCSHMLFLNAGDTLATPHALADIRESITPDVDLVFGDAVMVVRGRWRLSRAARSPERYLWRGLPALHQATVFRSDLLRREQYQCSFRIAGDYALVATVVKAGARWTLLHSPIAEFMVGGTSLRHPFRLLRESDSVRRNVLGLSKPLRALAVCNSALSNIVLLSIWFASGCLAWWSGWLGARRG